MSAVDLLNLPVLRTLRNARLRAAVAAILLVGAAVRFLLSLREAADNMTDYRVYFLPYATRAWHGVGPYKTLAAGDGSHFASPLDGSNYPPTFLFLMWPWTVLPDLLGRLAWITIEVACVAAVIGVVAWSLGGFTPTQLMVTTALVLLFPPLRDSINEGQVSLLLGALVVVAVGLVGIGRGRPAGVLLGIAIAIKITPILLLPYFAWRRQWALVISSVVTSGILVGLTFLVGWGSYWATFLQVLQQISQGTANVLNQSLNGVLLRAFDARLSGYPIPPPPPAFRVALLVTQGLVAAALVLFVVGGRLPPREQSWANIALLLLALPLLQPFAWPHHYAQGAVIAPVTVALASRRLLPPASVVACLVAYFTLLLLGYPLFVRVARLSGAGLMADPVMSAAASLQFFLVIATCVAWAWVRRTRPPELPPDPARA